MLSQYSEGAELTNTETKAKITVNIPGLPSGAKPLEVERIKAGTTTRFSFGDALECADEGEVYCELMDKYMWWWGNYTYGKNVSGTKEADSKLPNP